MQLLLGLILLSESAHPSPIDYDALNCLGTFHSDYLHGSHCSNANTSRAIFNDTTKVNLIGHTKTTETSTTSTKNQTTPGNYSTMVHDISDAAESTLTDSSGQLMDVINSAVNSKMVSQLTETLKNTIETFMVIIEKLTTAFKILLAVIVSIIALYCMLIFTGCCMEYLKIRREICPRQREGCLASNEIRQESVPLKDIIVNNY